MLVNLNIIYMIGPRKMNGMIRIAYTAYFECCNNIYDFLRTNNANFNLGKYNVDLVGKNIKILNM